MSEAPQPSSPESISDVQPQELIFDHKILYHGSATPEIELFNSAEEVTVGEGVYLVDNPEDASGYARRSADDYEGSPVVYEVEVEEARIVNLDNPEKLAEIMTGYAQYISRIRTNSPNLRWNQQGAIDRALEQIARGVRPGVVKRVTQTNGKFFTSYLKELGYGGLKTGEGGEPPYVGDHDTYVIFDSARIKILSEKPI